MALYPSKNRKILRDSPLRLNLQMVDTYLERNKSTTNKLSKASLSSFSDNLNLESVSKFQRVKKQKEGLSRDLKSPIATDNSFKRTTSTSREHYRPFGKQSMPIRQRPENKIWPSEKVIARIIELRDEIQKYREKEARRIPFEGKSHHLRWLEYELQLEDKKRQLALYGRCPR